VSDLTCTRRRFLGSTSLIAAAAAVPAAWHWADTANAPAMLVSAERAPLFRLGSQALLFDGPRLARLEAMAAALPKIAGEVVLRLDPVDDSLLDIAAQQSGMSVVRQHERANTPSIRAHVTPTRRTFA